MNSRNEKSIVLIFIAVDNMVRNFELALWQVRDTCFEECYISQYSNMKDKDTMSPPKSALQAHIHSST